MGALGFGAEGLYGDPFISGGDWGEGWKFGG
jgi:hypothetical protein